MDNVKKKNAFHTPPLKVFLFFVYGAYLDMPQVLSIKNFGQRYLLDYEINLSNFSFIIF